MIKLLRKEDCTGCYACQDICPTRAIGMQPDFEGFAYPHIDRAKCIDCHLCEKTCPVINAGSLTETNAGTPEVYAAYTADDAIRMESSSGGVFSVLAGRMLERNGHVAGAVWDEGFNVEHRITNKAAEAEAFRGSKYVQSDASGLFAEVKRLLNAGEQVLVSGTPCQMAALRAFLGKPYENLLIVDFVCNSVNSPKVFRAYLDDLESEANSRIIKYSQRNKQVEGWKQFAVVADFEDGRQYVRIRKADDFIYCFLGTHISSRPSCADCRYKQLPRVADITIADFWGIEKTDPEMYSSKGTSLVLLNNEKGKAYFSEVAEKLVIKNEPLKAAVDNNTALIRNPVWPKVKRDKFYKALADKGFRYAMQKYSHPVPSLKERVWIFGSRVKHALLRR